MRRLGPKLLKNQMRMPTRRFSAGPNKCNDGNDQQSVQKDGENEGKVRGSDELNNIKDKNEKYNKKSNRMSQALSIPVLCNMNP
jgi:hypothetical protein